MADEVDVVVAAVAFGTGVDKANVRFVSTAIRATPSTRSTQKVRRAGRDGEPAEATLFFRAEDLGLRRFVAGSGQGRQEGDRRDRRGGVARTRRRLDRGAARAERSVAGQCAERSEPPRGRGEVVATAVGGDPRSAVDAAVRAHERREALEASRLEMMRSYAELRGGCRREFVLNYFGADYRGPCGRCDNCEAERVAERRGDELPFDVGSRVAHREWGGGVVHGYDDGRVTVLFDEVGYRTLALELVAERDLLAAEEA
jgi:ATP-dependent DNA helicase RecQ